MDSITQAVLGASVGEAVLGKKIGNKAAILGAIGGTIPDLDVVLVPFFNELEKISLHRGYSHSILFCLVAAVVFAWLLGKLKWTKGVGFGRRWLFSFLVLFTHVILDVFTCYGTQLFLPFTDLRVGFDSITIIDPAYTLPLAIGLTVALFKNKYSKVRRWWNCAGLIVSSIYLFFTLVNKQRVESVFQANLQEQGISCQRMLTVPVSAANWTWYGVANDGDYLHIGKYNPICTQPIAFEKFPINVHFLDGFDSTLVDRMVWFSKGFYAVAEHGAGIRFYNLQVDMQGFREAEGYLAPTAFYYEITPHADGDYELTSGVHPKAENE